MKITRFLAATAMGALVASPAFAQDAADDDANNNDIIVTAQRQAQSLQQVPIAVSAFSAEALESQQIENASDLQLTLPNVTFTKSNFTSSSFTIRGIGDLCVGTSCDSATAIHLNSQPLFGTRLFETEYFDLEQIEVLRGPQGTLFGRSATSGVVNVITAKPKLGLFEAKGTAEYGNFKSIKVQGMVNVPIGETAAVRVAGFYLNRDGYTTNTFNNSQIDGRDMYAIRGSLKWEPTSDTTINLLGYYFREKDNRLRIQKQQCQNDPTGILGCLNARRDFGKVNTNATFTGTLGSREFLTIAGIPAAFGLGSIYDPASNGHANFVESTDVRTINTDFTPTYETDELQIQGQIEHNFGSIQARLSGTYQDTAVDSQQDYNQSIVARAAFVPGLTALAGAGGAGSPIAAYIAPIVAAITPGGPNGQLCTSLADPTGLGSFAGRKICGPNPISFDRSEGSSTSWSTEAVISSDFDGPFNFLLGGIYAESKSKGGSYYVNTFAIDYIAGILGGFTSLGGGLTPSVQGTPFFRNHTPFFKLKSYGIFGEVYYDITDNLKFTGGLRYNNDDKSVQARSTLASFLVPFNQTGDAFNTPFGAQFDADAATACTAASRVGAIGSAAGCDAFSIRNVKFDALTGRVVLDWQITDEHLLYASYSRGYKSGGINPPLQPIFAVSDSFAPEFVNAFEIGSKNTLADGRLQLNATAFFYQYKGLQLSRIIARTSVNDNVDADIYGAEIEALFRPDPNVLINMGFSYLHTEVVSDKTFSNPRDPGGGRADAVIIKDVTNGSNCAVTPNTPGNAAGANGFVTAINAAVGLRAPVAFPTDGGIASTGAYGICAALAAQAAGAAGAAFGGITVTSPGVPLSIKGNALPQAPNFKFSVGAQYTVNFESGMNLVPRIDLTYTGDSFGNIFNGKINKVEGYAQANASLQLNAAEDRWFIKGFVQNIFDNNATTGLYLTDASSGLFTNIFTLDPRRYGIAIGAKF